MKNCNNCEKKNVCKAYTDKNEVCNEWQGWISPEDEVPKNWQDVMFLVNPEELHLGWYNEEEGLLVSIKKVEIEDALAWRPLPKYEEANV